MTAISVIMPMRKEMNETSYRDKTMISSQNMKVISAECCQYWIKDSHFIIDYSKK